MREEKVRYWSSGDAGHIVFDTPPANIMTKKSFEEISTALDQFRNDSSIKQLIFFGANHNFSAGASLRWLEQLQNSPNKARETVDYIYKIGLQIGSFPKLTIAAIEDGICAGIGLELALLCDRIVAFQKNASTIKFKAGASEHGFMLGLGTSRQLVEKIGFRNAAVFLFNPEYASLEKAHRLCLVDYYLLGNNFEKALDEFRKEVLKATKPRRTAIAPRDFLQLSQREIQSFSEEYGAVVVEKTLSALQACRRQTLEGAMSIEKRYFLELLLSENAKKKIGEYLASIDAKRKSIK